MRTRTPIGGRCSTGSQAFPRLVAATAEDGGGRPDRGEWTAREIVGHLVIVETEVWQARLGELAAGRTPRWSWTEPGISDDPRAATLFGALELLASLRSATVAHIAGLDEAGWARTGIHATYGPLDVTGLIRIALDHDADHLAQLGSSAGA